MTMKKRTMMAKLLGVVTMATVWMSSPRYDGALGGSSALPETGKITGCTICPTKSGGATAGRDERKEEETKKRRRRSTSRR